MELVQTVLRECGMAGLSALKIEAPHNKWAMLGEAVLDYGRIAKYQGDWAGRALDNSYDARRYSYRHQMEIVDHLMTSKNEVARFTAKQLKFFQEMFTDLVMEQQRGLAGLVGLEKAEFIANLQMQAVTAVRNMAAVVDAELPDTIKAMRAGKIVTTVRGPEAIKYALRTLRLGKAISAARGRELTMYEGTLVNAGEVQAAAMARLAGREVVVERQFFRAMWEHLKRDRYVLTLLSPIKFANFVRSLPGYAQATVCVADEQGHAVRLSPERTKALQIAAVERQLIEGNPHAIRMAGINLEVQRIVDGYVRGHRASIARGVLSDRGMQQIVANVFAFVERVHADLLDAEHGGDPITLGRVLSQALDCYTAPRHVQEVLGGTLSGAVVARDAGAFYMKHQRDISDLMIVAGGTLSTVTGFMDAFTGTGLATAALRESTNHVGTAGMIASSLLRANSKAMMFVGQLQKEFAQAHRAGVRAGDITLLDDERALDLSADRRKAIALQLAKRNETVGRAIGLKVAEALQDWETWKLGLKAVALSQLQSEICYLWGAAGGMALGNMQRAIAHQDIDLGSQVVQLFETRLHQAEQSAVNLLGRVGLGEEATASFTGLTVEQVQQLEQLHINVLALPGAVQEQLGHVADFVHEHPDTAGLPIQELALFAAENNSALRAAIEQVGMTYTEAARLLAGGKLVEELSGLQIAVLNAEQQFGLSPEQAQFFAHQFASLQAEGQVHLSQLDRLSHTDREDVVAHMEDRAIREALAQVEGEFGIAIAALHPAEPADDRPVATHEVSQDPLATAQLGPFDPTPVGGGGDRNTHEGGVGGMGPGTGFGVTRGVVAHAVYDAVNEAQAGTGEKSPAQGQHGNLPVSMDAQAEAAEAHAAEHAVLQVDVREAMIVRPGDTRSEIAAAFVVQHPEVAVGDVRHALDRATNSSLQPGDQIEILVVDKQVIVVATNLRDHTGTQVVGSGTGESAVVHALQQQVIAGDKADLADVVDGALKGIGAPQVGSPAEVVPLLGHAAAPAAHPNHVEVTDIASHIPLVGMDGADDLGDLRPEVAANLEAAINQVMGATDGQVSPFDVGRVAAGSATAEGDIPLTVYDAQGHAVMRLFMDPSGEIHKAIIATDHGYSPSDRGTWFPRQEADGDDRLPGWTGDNRWSKPYLLATGQTWLEQRQDIFNLTEHKIAGDHLERNTDAGAQQIGNYEDGQDYFAAWADASGKTVAQVEHLMTLGADRVTFEDNRSLGSLALDMAQELHTAHPDWDEARLEKEVPAQLGLGTITVDLKISGDAISVQSVGGHLDIATGHKYNETAWDPKTGYREIAATASTKIDVVVIHDAKGDVVDRDFSMNDCNNPIKETPPPPPEQPPKTVVHGGVHPNTAVADVAQSGVEYEQYNLLCIFKVDPTTGLVIPGAVIEHGNIHAYSHISELLPDGFSIFGERAANSDGSGDQDTFMGAIVTFENGKQVWIDSGGKIHVQGDDAATAKLDAWRVGCGKGVFVWEHTATDGAGQDDKVTLVSGQGEVMNMHDQAALNKELGHILGLPEGAAVFVERVDPVNGPGPQPGPDIPIQPPPPGGGSGQLPPPPGGGSGQITDPSGGSGQ
ncbi:MAG: hypothetical protein WC364_10420 [Eubacteriales bacterium]|jgi:hypothetical protein